MKDEILGTHKVIRSGQKRRYGDSESVVEVYLKEGLTKEEASDSIRNMGIGFDDSKNKQWFESKLSYLRETSPGTWEYCMVSAYTG